MNAKWPVLLVGALLFSLFTLQGCASIRKDKAFDLFSENARLYGRLLRWREYEKAADMIRHQDGSAVNMELDKYKHLRVIDYEIRQIVTNKELKTAVVEAEISYYFETANAVNKIRDTQNWWYSKPARGWFLDGHFPAF